MLLIPDIHINSRMRDAIIDELRRLVVENSEENSVIFLGDYVYHFAYDRQSLLVLFRFFVELYHQGKDVYVLAGNHDWISEQFVYEEGKLATEMIMAPDNKENKRGKLQFITEVVECSIDGERVLFLPYNISTQEPADRMKEKKDGNEKGDTVLESIQETVETLLVSKHKGEQFSGRVNATLLEELRLRLEYKDTETPLLVIHHYYLEGVQFPGQRGRFGFKDVALDRRFAEIPGVRMVSGHIHQPFVHQNYLCMGSLRATSPLEINQYKIAGIYRENQMKVLCLAVNAYMRIESHEVAESGVVVTTDGDVTPEKTLMKIDKSTIVDEQKRRWTELQQNMSSTPFRSVVFGESTSHDQKSIKLQLVVDRVDYNVMDEYIESDLQREIGDIQLKKKGTGLEALVEKMSLADKNLREGFADRKEVLKLYLSQKYGDEEEEYLEILRKLKLL